jgi:hypothetical protein
LGAANSATPEGVDDGGEALRVGSNPEHNILRISCDLPFGEGAALALRGYKRLELFVKTTPWLVPYDHLTGATPYIRASIGQRSPLC